MRKLITVDLFSGIGGASEGYRQATGQDPTVAINHWDYALEVHAANHPGSRHIKEDLFKVDPDSVQLDGPLDILWGSPSCTKHSRASGKKGDTDTDRQLRSQPWIITEWARKKQPRMIFVENVVDIKRWTATASDVEGTEYQRWLKSFRDLGYHVEEREIAAVQHGVPTLRNRLFIVMRRDGLPIVWPQGTPERRDTLSILNFTHECPSVLGRPKGLAQSSCERIAKGIVKYVLDPARRTLLPGGILKGPDRSHEAAGWLVKNYTGIVGHELTKPLGTITATDHHGLGICRLSDLDSCDAQQADCTYGFICQYYSQGGQWSALDQPLGTIVTKGRFSLVSVRVNGQTKVITDIGYRMLQPRELADGQGFPASYLMHGTKENQIRGVGNSVSPPVARDLIAANLAA